MPERVTLVYVGDRIVVNVEMACGNKFNGVAFILNPDSPAPLLYTPKPLGIRTVRLILALLDVDKEGAKNGENERAIN